MARLQGLVEIAVIGGAVGAILGAIIGAIHSRQRGAVIGAIAGAIVVPVLWVGALAMLGGAP
jgi:hypothetical protein